MEMQLASCQISRIMVWITWIQPVYDRHTVEMVYILTYQISLRIKF